MNQNELIDKLCNYTRTNLASKASSKVVQFMLGASTAGMGRKAIESKAALFTPFCTDANGQIDVPALKESIISGFDTSGSIPVFGGLITLDKGDAEDFFNTISPSAVVQTTTTTPPIDSNPHI